MRKLSRREKRIVTAGVLVAVLSLLLVEGLSFLERQAEASDRVGEKKQLLERSIREVIKHDLYEAQLEELNRSLASYRGGLLDAQDSSIARIQLEELVRTLATEQGVTITRSNPLQERKIGDRYSKITLQLNLQTEIDQLTQFLYALSSHGKFLLVEEFVVQGFRRRDQIQIRPRLNVSAFIRLS